MTKHECREEFRDYAEGSWHQATEAVNNQISWLEWVRESELSSAERDTLLAATEAYYVVLRQLTAKYID